MLLRIFYLIILSFLLSACEKFVLLTTAKKMPQVSNTPLATTAETHFWTALHGGQYEQIPLLTKLLTNAYLQNPNDPQLAAHLGFVHIWKITERAREKHIEPTIVNEIILAEKYFSDAVTLNPQDARMQGFLGDSMLITGKIFHDQRQQVRGYYQLKAAIAMWPEFNLFTAAFPMSTLDPKTVQFKEGLEWLWQTLTLCAGEKINRAHPDFTPYLYRETQSGPLRACWNSWIAPHNFEGYFLNMGDMLVKNGQWQTAISIYNNAKLSKTYQDWPYKKMLENRIVHAQENVANFQRPPSKLSPDATLLFDSGYGCAVCHQDKTGERK